MGTTIKSVPVEAHNSISMVERYHGPLRRIYHIITSEIPGIDKDMALQMAFKAINDSAGPDSLIPTLLVFGAYPRMTESDAPSPTVTQRAIAFKKAMEEVKKIQAERQVADALNMRNGPSTTAIHDLPLMRCPLTTPMIFLLLYTYYCKRGSTGSLAFKELPVSEYIRFTYHVFYTRDLRETRIQ